MARRHEILAAAHGLVAVVGEGSVSMSAGGFRVGPLFGGLSLAAGAAWYASLMRPVLAAATLGPICTHGGALALHCSACYAALALAGSGLALLIPASIGRRAPARILSGA